MGWTLCWASSGMVSLELGGCRKKKMITFFSRWKKKKKKRTNARDRICRPAVQNPPGLDQVRALKTFYPWTEVDDAVELHDHAGFAFLESELAVFQARAGSEQSPGEAAGLPDPHVALQFAAVLVLHGLIWRNGARSLSARRFR